ncbi:MAG: hypothetical protein WC212_02955 [Candidatus Delongbacteria bacterium]
MKKVIALASVGIIAVMLITSCGEENNDPPEFTNGLMVTLAQNPVNNPDGIESEISFTARSFVECLYQYGNTYTFSAETTSGDKWTVKLRWDGTDADSIVYISDNSLNKIEMASAEYGNYYINSSSGNAGQTSVKILRLVPEEIIEAEFEGYIYEQGASSDPDTLKNGYLITNKFVLSK